MLSIFFTCAPLPRSFFPLRRALHLCLDVVRHHQEGRVNKGARLGRRLQEVERDRLGKRFALGRRHLPNRVVALALVAHQQLVRVLRRVPINLVQPRLHVVERGAVGDIVNDDDAVRAAVVAARLRCLRLRGRLRRRLLGSIRLGSIRLGSSSLGSSRNRALYPRVPDLQLDRLAVELDRPDPEFAARRRDVPVGELVVLWAQESGIACG